MEQQLGDLVAPAVERILVGHAVDAALQVAQALDLLLEQQVGRPGEAIDTRSTRGRLSPVLTTMSASWRSRCATSSVWPGRV